MNKNSNKAAEQAVSRVLNSFLLRVDGFVFPSNVLYSCHKYHLTVYHKPSTVVVTVEETQGKKIECFPSRWRWDLVAGVPEEELMNEKDWRKSGQGTKL